MSPRLGTEAVMQRQAIHDELDRVRADFVQLIDRARVAELRQPSDGTKWTNEQLLFHMLFGYLLVTVLLWLVRGFSRLPDGASHRFAAVLNRATRPFHVINYVGSLAGARVLGYPGMQRLMGQVIATYTAPSTDAATRTWPAACTSRSGGTPTSTTS